MCRYLSRFAIEAFISGIKFSINIGALERSWQLIVSILQRNKVSVERKKMKFLILTVVLIGLVAGQRRDNRCPVNQNGRNPTQLPHPTDCGMFLKCFNGMAYDAFCPQGQHWNAAANFCDSPQNARCMTNSGPQRPQQPGRPSPPRPQQPVNPRPEIEHPDFLNCPFNDTPGRVVFFPYHLNCSQFYQCVNGRAVL